MTKTLELIFKTADGAKKTLSISNPKDDLTKQEAMDAMQQIITANCFETTAGDLVEAVEARIVTRAVEALA